MDTRSRKIKTHKEKKVMATTKQVKDFIRKVAPVAQAKASGREQCRSDIYIIIQNNSKIIVIT